MKALFFLPIMTHQKAIQFEEHKQVSMLIYWSKINVQIRLSGNIDKTNEAFNKTILETEILVKTL